jgi:hypothetical protein
MAIALLIAGIGFLLAGVAQIVFGIPVKEFSFGNTLLTTGAVTTCTGAIMIGIWIAIREFRDIAQHLGAVAPQHPAAAFSTAPAPAIVREPLHDNDGFALDQPAAAKAEPAPAAPPSLPAPPAPPPWHEETASRDRGRADAPSAAPADAAAKQRRNLLFSSTSRKERERAEARSTDMPPLDPAHPVSSAAPPPAVPPPARPSEAPPGSFEEAWPQRRGGRAPSTFAEGGTGAAVADRSPPPRSEEPAPVTVLKSGVVDGMAYSLYSDGSIEAQMPEGMMRFASIDELRAHLDQRG